MERQSKVIVLVSPICDDSLIVSAKIREWAESKGIEVEELSILTKEGQEIVMALDIDTIPAVVVNGEIISQGDIPDLKLLERALFEG